MGAIIGADINNTSMRASAVLRSEVRFNLKKIILFSILALFYAAGSAADGSVMSYTKGVVVMK